MVNNLMDEVIEASIESADGVIDCRFEPVENGYNVTILYPNIVNGYSRSEIHCHDMHLDEETGVYFFDSAEDIHPRISKLQPQLSDIIARHLQK